MNKINNLTLVLLISNVALYANGIDSLKWSIGYGTLFGGGIGAKYETQLWDNVKLHFAISPALLQTINHDEAISNNFINIYQNFNKRMVVDKQDGVSVCFNRLIIPFSLNVSYTLNKHVNIMLGCGTISRAFDFVKVNYQTKQVYLIEFYKTLTSNISISFNHKRWFSCLTFSSLYIPLRTYGGESGSFRRESYSAKQFSLGFSVGYKIF